MTTPVMPPSDVSAVNNPLSTILPGVISDYVQSAEVPSYGTIDSLMNQLIPIGFFDIDLSSTQSITNVSLRGISFPNCKFYSFLLYYILSFEYVDCDIELVFQAVLFDKVKKRFQVSHRPGFINTPQTGFEAQKVNIGVWDLEISDTFSFPVTQIRAGHMRSFNDTHWVPNINGAIQYYGDLGITPPDEYFFGTADLQSLGPAYTSNIAPSVFSVKRFVRITNLSVSQYRRYMGREFSYVNG